MRAWLLVGVVAIASCKDAGGGKPDAGAADAAAPADAGDAGPALPADDAMPAANAELSVRMRHVLEAISQDNADLASDALFPRDAYIATKDLPDPQKAWEKRLQGVFRRAVTRTHKNVKGVEQARFVGFDLGRTVTQLTPRKRDFKKPLWRVKRSRLSFTIDGKPHHVDIAEMTGWRGAWYITRLR